MRSKAKSQRIHSFRRALERHGLNFGQRTRASFLEKIQSGGAVFLEKQSNRVTIYAVNHEDVYYPVAYDKKRKEIATLLPQKFLDNYRDKLILRE